MTRQDTAVANQFKQVLSTLPERDSSAVVGEALQATPAPAPGNLAPGPIPPSLANSRSPSPSPIDLNPHTNPMQNPHVTRLLGLKHPNQPPAYQVWKAHHGGSGLGGGR